jgi:hypothetical protein
MTQEEFARLVMAIRTYYPKEKILPNKEAMQLWYEQLNDLEYATLSMSLQKWVNTEKWSPTIADLRRLSTEITTPSLDIDAGQSFQEARKMIQTYGRYRREDAFANMTPITRKVVERMGYDTMCDCENIEVERGQFTKIFDNLSQRDKQDAQLPSKLKELITSTTMKLEDKR